jgi:hypothetical protein
LKAISFQFLESTMKIALGIFLITEFYTNKDQFITNTSQFYKINVSFSAIHYVTLISFGLNIILWLFLGKLITLHIWLHHKKLTTYESIMIKRGEMQPPSNEIEAHAVPKRSRRSKAIKQLDEHGKIQNARPEKESASDLQIDIHSKHEYPTKANLCLSEDGKDNQQNKEDFLNMRSDKLDLSSSNFAYSIQPKFKSPSNNNTLEIKKKPALDKTSTTFNEFRSIDMKNESSMSMLIKPELLSQAGTNRGTERGTDRMSSTTRGYRLKEGTYDYEKQDTMKNSSFNSQIPLRFRSEETDEKILSQEVLTTESKKTLATTERRPRTKRNKILPTSGWEIESPTRSQDTEILRDFKATTINGNENNEASGSVGDLKAILSVGGATQSEEQITLHDEPSQTDFVKVFKDQNIKKIDTRQTTIKTKRNGTTTNEGNSQTEIRSSLKSHDPGLSSQIQSRVSSLSNLDKTQSSQTKLVAQPKNKSFIL